MLHCDADLARRLELTEAQNQADFVTTLNRVYPDMGAACEAIGGGYAVFAGKGSPITRAMGLGWQGPVSDADLDAVEAFYARLGEPPQVDLCPLADPSLLRLLGRRHYAIRWFLNANVRPLFPDEEFGEPAEGITVERVQPDDLDLWALTVSRGFEGQDKPALTHPSIAYATSRKRLLVPFLARVDGEPAGGGAMELRDGLAVFASTAVRVQFRGRGVQTALLNARLASATAAGCDLALVWTTPGSASQRNVERAGFRIAYLRARMIKE